MTPAPFDVVWFAQAAAFAAEQHRLQKRKDAEASPYVTHPLIVARLVAEAGFDTPTVMAAVLHDVLEDTAWTERELAGLFGPQVAALVREVTDDKALPWKTRKDLQVQNAPSLSTRAKAIRIADKIANVTDVIHRPPVDWSEMKRAEYMAWATRVVTGCMTVETQKLHDQYLGLFTANVGDL